MKNHIQFPPDDLTEADHDALIRDQWVNATENARRNRREAVENILWCAAICAALAAVIWATTIISSWLLN